MHEKENFDDWHYNKYVFNAVWKDKNGSMQRIFPLQSFGAADWNALSPSVAKRLPLGGVSDRLSDDLKLYLEFIFMDVSFTR